MWLDGASIPGTWRHAGVRFLIYSDAFLATILATYAWGVIGELIDDAID